MSARQTQSAWINPERPAPRRWLSQAEAADYIGVTERTIRNYVSRGAIRAHRIKGSRLIRFDRHDLDTALRPIPAGGGDLA